MHVNCCTPNFVERHSTADGTGRLFNILIGRNRDEVCKTVTFVVYDNKRLFYLVLLSPGKNIFGITSAEQYKETKYTNKKSDECGAHVYIVPQRAA